ncbi:MAG TPA: His/Gly/Thr/Pro-type tRNA ligase C-terminal domain-containing protein, partial [Candidatus Binatia bacterium]|nr:His/Gly/Thr/Pro-type tRNA ligase C-terminal domain-containing protein [Candidatus Binatia bacterium]
APVQAVVVPISEHQLEYANTVRDALRRRGLRIDSDPSNEKLGYKIRHWKTQKVPYILVVGKSEAAEGTVNVNERGIEEKRTLPIDAFAHELAEAVSERR